MRFWATAGGLASSFVATASVLGTYALFNMPPNPWVVVSAATGTLLIYQFDRAWLVSPEDRINAEVRLIWAEANRRGLLIVAIAAGLFGLFALWQLSSSAQWLAVVLGSLGLLYAVPVSGRRVKNAGMIKPWLIGTAWGVGSVVFPVVSNLGWLSVSVPVVTLAGYRGLIVAANVYLTDQADAEGDACTGLRTASVRWSESTVRGVAALLSILAVLILFVWATSLWKTPWIVVAVDAMGPLLLAVSALGGRRAPIATHPLFLDLLVGWPLATYVVWYMI